MSEQKAPKRTQQKHYRNIRGTPISVRLKELDRKIELAPRGMRGDCAPIKKGEQSDPDFIANKDLLFEVITDEEYKAVVEKQTTNQQQSRRHPALANIRNELGDEYESDAIKLDASENEDKSRTVAHLDEVAEGVGNVVIDRQVGIRRAEVPGSTDRDLPHVPDSVAPEDQAQYLADQRAKDAKNLDELDLKVTKGDTQQA